MLKLLRSRTFGPLFWTQLLGAFNDNLLKSALVAGLTFGGLSQSAMPLDVLVQLATAILVVPFFLFSAIAGEIADSMDKARLARILKVVEVAVMVLALAGFALSSVPVLFVALFCMGVQSAFFGPVKYALLPQHVAEENLIAANAMVEAATFIAIVIGTLLGTLGMAWMGGPWFVGITIVVVALLGARSAAKIPDAPSAAPRPLREALRPWRALKSTIRSVRTRSLRRSIAGVSAFWLVGAVLLGQLPLLARDAGAGENGLALFLTTFSIGIGVGSFLAERASSRLGNLSDAITGVGALGLALSLYGLAGAQGVPWSCVALFMAGLSGGLFIVPLYAAMQSGAAEHERARVVAANNLFNALFMAIGAGYAAWMLSGGTAVNTLVSHLGHFALLMCVLALVINLREVLHLLIRQTVRAMYRIDAKGLERLPKEGAALVAVNHQSFVDAFVVGAMLDRPMRFVMDHRMANLPLLKYFFRFAGAIPIAGYKDRPDILAAALESVDEALKNGEVVAIFPEGKCTRDGEVDVFKDGIKRIVERTPVPIVPTSLEGLFGGFFSYAGGYPMTHAPRLFRSPVIVRMGTALPTLDSPAMLRERVLELMSQSELTSGAETKQLAAETTPCPML